MPVGNNEPVFEDASYFFEGMDGNMQQMPETIFLGPHMTERPFEDTADFIREAGVQEAKGQPAQITGGPGIEPQSPVHMRERGYDYQEEMNPIRKDFQRMMTPVVSEPQRAERPNRSVNSPVPPVAVASGLDYDKPRTDTVFVDPSVAVDTPELLPHSGVAPEPGQREAYQHPVQLVEGIDGNPDDGVVYNGEGYSTDQERHSSRSRMHIRLDDYAMSDEAPTPPDAVYSMNQSRGRSVEEAADNLSGRVRGPGVPDGTGPYGGTRRCQLSGAPPEIPMVMLAEEPVADVPTITLASLGFWPWARNNGKRPVRSLKNQPPEVVATAVNQGKARKMKRRQRKQLRLADVSKEGKAKQLLENVKAGSKPTAEELDLKAATLAARTAKNMAANDPSFWIRFTRNNQAKFPQQPQGYPAVPGFIWKKNGKGLQLQPVGAEAKALYAKAYGQLKQSERVKIQEARQDLRVAEEEIQGLESPEQVQAVSQEARTPDELRAEGACVARKMIQAYSLDSEPQIIEAVSGQVAGAMIEDIKIEADLAKTEIAVRQERLKALDQGQTRSLGAYPAITIAAFLPDEGGYYQ